MTLPIVSELIELLKLEPLEVNLFRGQSRDIGTKYVFGGQVLGQALSAAQQTVPHERLVHSLHGYFLRAGDITAPIIYQVEVSRDGKSFSTRRVSAIQHGQLIFGLAASFQEPEPGVEHQVSMPDVPKPEDLDPPEEITPEAMSKVSAKLQRWLTRHGPFEFRHVYPRDEIKPPKRPPHQHVWMKLVDRIGDDQDLHRSMLAYASDYHLIGTTTFPHGISYLQPNVMMASLDHAMWFHRPFRVDDWLLYSCDSPSAQGARGLARGSFYTRDGVLVASTTQEGLIRIIDGEKVLMRQVYSSPRIENVDRVVLMLENAGIPTRVVNRDKLNRDRFQRFSYTEENDSRGWPAVQIVSAEDMPKARELLRAAGLMGSTRPDAEPPMPHWEAPGNTPDRTAARMRRAAMIGVFCALVALAFFYARAERNAPPPAPAPAAVVAPPVEDNTVFLIDESESESENKDQP